MKFAIVVNTERMEPILLAKELCSWLERNRTDFVLESLSAEKTGLGPSAGIGELSSLCGAFISLGGDGTLLFTSHYSAARPVIGINVGHLGFLTEFSKDEIIGAIEKVVSGDYTTHHRTQLEAIMKPHLFRALNDVVIEKGTYSRIPAFVIRIDGKLLGSYRADGIIIATSTGSTAYSMSAGGPIIAPKSCVFVITPICPHMLTVRPVVISDDKTIEISVDAQDGEFPLNCDGRIRKMLRPGETVTVRKSEAVVNMVVNENRDYFEVLRTKLLWGRKSGSNQ